MSRPEPHTMDLKNGRTTRLIKGFGWFLSVVHNRKLRTSILPNFHKLLYASCKSSRFETKLELK